MRQTEALRGPIAVTVTPMTAFGEPNYEALRKQTDWLCGKEITGLFPCSSTGEFIKFRAEEQRRILRTVASVNARRKRLIAGACGACLRDVLQSIGAAAEYGYDACVVCPPYYYPQTQADIIRFYTRVASEAREMKMILYNVPFFTTGLTLDTVRSLMDVENIVGIKDSSANMKQIAHTNQVKPERFLVYSGTDDCLLPALAAGCDGSMTALAGSMPEWIAMLYQRFREGNIAEAMRLQHSALPLLRAADSLPFPFGYKLLAEARGLEIGPLPLENERISAVRARIQAEVQKLLQGGVADESNGLAGL